MSSLSSSAASAKRRASRAASELSSSRRISTYRSSAERSKRSAASVNLLDVVAQPASATRAATVNNAFMFIPPHMCGTRDKRWIAERSFGGGRRQEKSTCHSAIHSRNHRPDFGWSPAPESIRTRLLRLFRLRLQLRAQRGFEPVVHRDHRVARIV